MQQRDEYLLARSAATIDERTRQVSPTGGTPALQACVAARAGQSKQDRSIHFQMD
jgi:hypothetical protein